MKRHCLTTAFSVAMIIIVGLLWFRVQRLETVIEELNQRLPSEPKTLLLSAPTPKKNGDSKQVFKLIETQNADPGKTKLGVPWDIERAMMGGSHENDQFIPHDTRYEIVPNSPKPDSQPQMNLDINQILQQLNSK